MPPEAASRAVREASSSGRCGRRRYRRSPRHRRASSCPRRREAAGPGTSPSMRAARSSDSRRSAPMREMRAPPLAPISGPAMKSSLAFQASRVPVPSRSKGDGGRPGDRGRLGQEAAGLLHQVRLQFELVALRHVGEREGEQPGRVETLGLGPQIQAFARRAELRAALGREPGGLARDLLPEHEVGEGEALDLDLHRKVGQQLAVGLGFRRCRSRQWAAQNLQAADLEGVDLEPPREQRQTAPGDPRLVELQPDSRAVAHRHVADRCVRGQGTVHRADGGTRDAGVDRAFDSKPPSTDFSASSARAGRAGRGYEKQRDEPRGIRCPCLDAPARPSCERSEAPGMRDPAAGAVIASLSSQ